MSRLLTALFALVASLGWGVLALRRGESVSAAWLVLAAVGTYLVAYRLYARFLARRVFELDPRRATPAERLENGRDYVPTGKYVLFGHHFAAIAGAGPLVGPVLAAQFGWLPGTLWIVFGVVLAGAVQDFTILVGSTRRDGRSLGQMAKEEIGPITGTLAMVAVLLIMVVLLASLALVVVNALRESPWGVFTIASTIPIAVLMGLWMTKWRPGRTGEATVFGIVMLFAALVGGRYIAASSLLAPYFSLSGMTLAWCLIAYGFTASVLPVWLLLAPRDYLSTFVKIGTVLLLAAGILFVLPDLKLPPLTRFIDGSGPIFAGKLFPFCFVTIACGAISGFHSLVASGTTPKMLRKETDAPFIGYGGMLMESFVAVMAMCAAAVLDPGVYFAINVPQGVLGGTLEAATQTIQQWGWTVTPEQLTTLAASMGETTIVGRTGGAPSLAVGMAQIFSHATGAHLAGLWYHFAILFEALFILTTIDAGTRVGRFMIQELGGRLWAPFARTSWYPASIAASVLAAGGWGWLLIQVVLDPAGGIGSLWPLFGISNQLLATVALAVGTTLIIKSGKGRYAWVTLAPLAWVVSVTFTAGWLKIFSADPRLGMLAHAAATAERVAAGTLDAAVGARVIFNDRLNSFLCALFLTIAALLLVSAVTQWIGILRRKVPRTTTETAWVESAYAD